MSQPLRVLIVDDSGDDATLLQYELRKGGYEVASKVVDTPAAMRAALQSQEWDVITSDHAMPQFSAPAALALAKEICPEVPFIIVSGEMDLNLAVSLMRGGARDFIQKRELPLLIPTIEHELREVELRHERQRADAALIESDERYRLLFQSIDSGFALHEIICDAQGVPCDYRFLEINPAFEKLTGLKAKALIGHTNMEMLPGTEKEWVERYGKVALTGESTHFENYSSELGKYYEVTAYSPKHAQFAVIFRDITERKQAEETQHEKAEHVLRSEARLNMAQSVAHVGDWTWNIKDKQVEWSDEMYRIFGIDKNSYTGRLGDAISKVIHPDDLHIVQPSNALAFVAKKSVEYRILWPDGSIRNILAETGETILDREGTPIYLTGTCQDITEHKRTEEILRAKEANLAEAQQIAHIGSWEWDMVLNTVRWSNEMYRVFDINPATYDEKPESLLKVIHPADIEIFTSSINSNLSSSQSPALEYRVIHRDGSIHNIAANSRVEFDQNGKPLRSMGTVQDITERKQAEETVRESEEKHRLLIENSHDIIYKLTAGGIFTFVSPAWTVLLGHPVTQVTGQSFQQFVHPDDIPGCMVWLQKLIETGTRQEGVEYRARHVDGSWNWHTSSAVPLRDKAGVVVGFEGIARDINQRKLVEDALRESEAKHKSMIANISDVIAIMAIDGTLKYKSSNSEKWFGWQPDDLIGTDGWDTVHPDDLERIQKEFWMLLEKDNAKKTVEYRYKCKDGSYKLIELTAVNLTNEPNIHGVLMNYHDITERKRMEETLRESETKLRKAQHYAHVGSWTWNIQDNHLDWSDEMFHIFGLERETFTSSLESVVASSIHPDDRAKVEQSNLRVSQDKQPVPLEYRVVWPDQSVHVVWAEAGELIEDEAGNPAQLSGIVQDITERKRVEEALRENTERNQTILQTAMDGFWLADMQGHLLEVNEAYCRMSGYTAPELLGMAILDLEVSESAAETAAHLQNVRTRGEDRFETRHRRKDGTLITVEISVQYRAEKGGLLVVFLRDVTERKWAEGAIYELKARIGEQERYSVLVELASDGFWLLDKQFRTVFVNPAMEEMLGYAREEMIGRSWYDFGDPDWVTRARELEKRREEGVREPHEFVFIHKQGRKVLTRIATTPLYDPEGNFNGALGILSDITRQKEAEEALKIKGMLNSIAQSSGIGMCLINPDYTIAWYNDLYSQWFGSLEGRKGRNCFEVFEGRTAICPGCPSKETFETGAVAMTERVGITTSAGADRIMAVSTSPVLDSDGNVIQVVEIGQDITERKLAVEEIHRLNSELEQRIADRTAQLTAANQELEAFSYSVSHDLRAPLRSLDGFSKVLLEDYAGQLDEPGQNYLARIQEASRRMGQLIQDLLDLSRVTRADFTRQRVDLSALAHSIAAELKAQSPNRRVEFEITAHMIVEGDGNLLKIVLENLLNNAYKFTSRREQASIQVGRVEQDGQWIYFVRDNGAGFDMDYANKLFGAFQRLHSEKEFPGTGIGLATVQRIIHRHGGRVWAEGVVGQGATFYFTIMPTG